MTALDHSKVLLASTFCENVILSSYVQYNGNVEKVRTSAGWLRDAELDALSLHGRRSGLYFCDVQARPVRRYQVRG